MKALEPLLVRTSRVFGTRVWPTLVILSCLIPALAAEPRAQPEVWLCAGNRINELLQSAPNFGDIGPFESSSTVARIYLAHGGFSEFLIRLATDREALANRQAWARP